LRGLGSRGEPLKNPGQGPGSEKASDRTVLFDRERLNSPREGREICRAVDFLNNRKDISWEGPLRGNFPWD